MDQQNILEVNNLTVVFHHEKGITTAVDDISFSMVRGETLGIVGESGSGKSVTALSILRLLPEGSGEFKKGDILFRDSTGSMTSLLSLTEKQMQGFRGKEAGMIFQEPMTSLNPVLTCGFQVSETLRWHQKINKKEARATTLEWFNEVGLPRTESIFKSYPHQLSGGMRQRTSIARTFAINPPLLLADEAFSALDEITAASLRNDLLGLIGEEQKTTVFITHSVTEASELAGRILIFGKPGHVIREIEAGKMRTRGGTKEDVAAEIREGLRMARVGLN